MISLTYFFNRHINLSRHGFVAIHIEQTSFLFRLIYFSFRLKKANKKENRKRGIVICCFPTETLNGSCFSREHAMLKGIVKPEYLCSCAIYKLLTPNLFFQSHLVYYIVYEELSQSSILCNILYLSPALRATLNILIN